MIPSVALRLTSLALCIFLLTTKAELSPPLPHQPFTPEHLPSNTHQRIPLPFPIDHNNDIHQELSHLNQLRSVVIQLLGHTRPLPVPQLEPRAPRTCTHLLLLALASY